MTPRHAQHEQQQTLPPPPLPPLLQIRGLCFAYPGAARLFDHWQADLPAGVHLLHGDTASGKTTLLQLLAGALRPEAGTCRLNGRLLGDDLAADPAASRATDLANPLAGRRPGAAPAGHHDVCALDLRAEAWDPLTPPALMAALQPQHPALDVAAWQAHLAGFGLAPHAAKPMYALSTGMRRKAGLAVALAAGAALTLLDEPTAGLDSASISYLAQALRQGWVGTAQRLVLMASSQRLEALPVDRVISLGPGLAGG